MSGAEALAGIGILCNVMQIVTFGKDALHVYRYVHENGTPDAKLEVYLTDASKIYQDMRWELSGITSPTGDQKEIIKVGEEAYKGLQILQTYFQKLSVDERSRKGFSGKLRIAKSGIKTLFRGKELEDLEKNFDRYQQLLQTRLIGRVCNRTDATALLAQDSFKTLDATQQCMIERIAQGHTDLSLLVSQKTIETKSHISNQHKETRGTLVHHLSVTEHKLHSHISESTSVIKDDLAYRSKTENAQARHDQILASLRYPEMNGRKNQVVKNFPRTFEWIFSSRRPWDDGSSSDDESSSSDRTSSHNGQSGHEQMEQNSDARRTDDDPAISKGSGEDRSTPEKTVFARWLGSEPQMFWISGKPASGKSTLMKFIATSPDTKKELARWRPNVNIISHYFWKAGSVMERSLKGFFLSLTHQVLLESVELSQRMWEDMPEVRHKWSHADWDLQQLETTLVWVLETAAEPFLLIIDGVDECEDLEKQLSTLPRRPNILDLLSQVKDVKMCVSSREEYTFINYFDGVERLQLHELTRHDIDQFADTRLGGLTFSKPEDRSKLLHSITTRASGVFLWVALVVDSVARAARLDNNIEGLIERVDHMPKDLIDLVREMWERSGDDGELPSYKATASRYFKLAHDVDDYALYHNSVLDFAVAADKGGLEFILDQDRIWDFDEMERLCLKTKKEIRILCHGLLEVADQNFLAYPTSVLELNKFYRTMQVRFAHRCVIDFLDDTVSGAALLGACGWSEEEVKARLAGSDMVLSRAFIINSTPHEVPPPTDHIHVTNNKMYLTHLPWDSLMECIMQNLTLLKRKNYYHNIIFHKFIEWHFGGMQFDRPIWSYSGQSIFNHDPIRNEFLASAAKITSTPFMKKLIENLYTNDFLSALPAIFRGLSAKYQRRETGPDDNVDLAMRVITLTEQILTRLRVVSKVEKGMVSLKAVTGESLEELQRLTCSWFLSNCVGFNYSLLDKEFKTLVRAILHQIALAFPVVEDWNQLILLIIDQENNSILSVSHQVNFHSFDYCSTCCFTINLATAFQIVLHSITFDTMDPRSNDSSYEPRLPEGATPSLRVMASYHKIQHRKNQGSYEDEGWLDYAEEGGDKVSESLLRSLLTGTRIEWEAILDEGQERREVASDKHELCYYLVARLGDTWGIPAHPWTWWFIADVSGQKETKDETSPQPLMEVLYKIWDS
ncbi:hypothetical protein FAUST_6640 [Fusarium austroamericanum]|uniref:NACHT domain-containing protein n=1 Tax=Fusarium austroamericanum TaxID=282268 RepID=A0AAN5Z9G0_FUSAU|nr:hypothetical protein FAUST_6640 [Fusarium austroamericanum]